MTDFLGRLLGEPGPRLRPQLPTMFDPGAPRLRADDGDHVPVAEDLPSAPAAHGSRPAERRTPGGGSIAAPCAASSTRSGGYVVEASPASRDRIEAAPDTASPWAPAPVLHGGPAPLPPTAQQSTAAGSPPEGPTDRPADPPSRAHGVAAPVSAAPESAVTQSVVAESAASGSATQHPREPVRPTAAAPAIRAAGSPASPGLPAHPVRPTHPVRPMRPPLRGEAPRTAAPVPEAVEPVVRITIDRLEVRAAEAKPEAPARPARRRPQLGLDEYLRGRS
ncbi:hypothetical protein STRCI_001098 [Streptomyces cinnabarinus]|uniref:Uncharacterized protein n=1 Tax=Streptomyces cinnabarinus TaxID=67287 RepID=A0ABY7K673_9ACTN|nr:hypothetical protein [Streptomyces cinnabarinus]WAZ20008.1 hypothetical protein STRCI_001098 [Streptomyces cinnabarinus]